MARGERGEGPRSGTDAYGLWAVLAVVVLFAAFLVALALRGCEQDPLAITPATPAPVAGAQVSFARLGDRDGSGPTTDPTQGGELRGRGYERLEGDVPATELAFRQATTALDALCGVAQVAPDPTSSVERGALGDLELAPGPLDGALTFGACGAHELAVRGVGRASVAFWVMPGLTPADVAASELPAEVALGFAEAEHLLGAEGWRATERALRAELAAGTASWAPPRPARGCTAWVIVALGFDSARSQHAGLDVHQDPRAGRQLLGAVSCADGGEVIVGDAAGDGGVLYALPFARGGGPRVPAAGTGRLTTIGAVRLGTADALTLPAEE